MTTQDFITELFCKKDVRAIERALGRVDRMRFIFADGAGRRSSLQISRRGICLMRTTIRWIFRGSAIAAALLATVQPVLGSFAFFRRGDLVDYETIHMVVGGIIYNLALLLVVLVLFTRFRRRWTLFSVCLLQYGFTHIQLRLGLGSNDDAGLLAYHIPIGILVLFLSYLTVALGFGLRLDYSRA